MRLSKLIELGLDFSSQRQPLPMLESFCRAAQELVPAKFAGAVLFDDAGVRYFTARGLSDAEANVVRREFDPSAPPLKQLLSGRAPQRLRDLGGNPTAAGLPASHPPIHTFLGVPVRSATRTYGLLYLAERLGADAFDENDEQFALALAWQLAPAYESLTLYGELRKYADRLELEAAEHRRTTERLRENEERYRLLWETTTDAIILLTPDNRIQGANPATKDVFGYNPDALIGKDIGVIQPERLRDAHRRAFAHYRATGSKTVNWRGMETVGLRRDGSEFPLEMAFSQLPVGGAPLFAAYMRDITARDRAEAALRESQSFLEQSQEVGGVGSWVSGLGADTTLWWSRQTYRIFGLPEDAPITVDTFFEFVHADDRDAVRQAVERVIASGGAYSIDHRIVRSDRSERWVHERADVVRDATGKPLRLIGVVQDITERKKQQDRIARLTRIHAVLSAINSAIIRMHERDALAAEACRIAVEAGRFPFAWIGIVDRAANRVRPIAWHGDEAGMLRILEPLFSLEVDKPEERGLVARAVIEKQAMISNDILKDARVRFRRELSARHIRSIAVLPLIVSDEAVGVMALRASEAGFFNEEEMNLLNELAGDISFGLQYIEKADKLDYLAYYDALTGLPNSTLFHDRLGQFLSAARSKELVAVIVLDLDRFTQLNDTLGRHVCDMLLQAVAERLGKALQEPFSLARIGADTFAVAVADLERGADAAAALHRQILDPLGPPLHVDGQEIRVTARAGIALYPSDGLTASELFKNAEAALQRARTSGERYLYYAPAINATVAEKLALENRLRRAAEREEFVPYYQPKIDAQTGRCLGLEALIRWNDPDNGLVLPESFIDVLEETGLILEVGRWVIDRALADHRRWREAGLRPPRIAVNVSPLQLRQANFAETVRSAIATHDAGTEALEIELTESLIMEDIDANIGTLHRIIATGTTIAIDDFGTGYSSLSYLAKLPVDSLKIDRSFIATMAADGDSMAIVSTIISLAHSLKLRVVAEGVETSDQARMLKRLGCDEMQGYLYSEALAPARIAVLLRDFG